MNLYTMNLAFKSFIFLFSLGNGKITFKIHTRKKVARGVTQSKKLVKKERKRQFVAEGRRKNIKKRK
jgi:hypothetical protein